MDIKLISAKTMCERMNINMETFRKTWKRWKYERVGDGHTLKSMRFYWQSGPILAETENADCKVSDKKRDTLASGNIRQRRAGKKQSRIHESPGSTGMGRRTADIEAAAKRFGFA